MSLALIAGRGALPAELAAAQAAPPLICGFEGAPPEGLSVDLTFRLETLGSLLEALHEKDITSVCFCGGIERPSLDASRLDAKTLPLVPLFQKALAAGDNGALAIVRDIFQQKGFEVLGAEALLPSLVTGPEVLSRAQPDAAMAADAARGAAVLAALSALDIGQACVVGRGQVLGVEAIGGTAHLMASLPPRAREMRGLLCKAPKAGQIREIDLPTIGPETLRQAAEAGLAGIVIQAGDVLILERDRCTALADELGLVLWSRAEGEG
jgi:hypothetical protein